MQWATLVFESAHPGTRPRRKFLMSTTKARRNARSHDKKASASSFNQQLLGADLVHCQTIRRSVYRGD